MKIQKRADNYIKSFPDYAPLQIFNDRIYSIWMIGNNYSKGTGYYGAYPHKLKERILSLFPDCSKILHLFSGEIKEGITFDIKPELNPTICDHVDNIVNHKDLIQDVDLIMADPPYDKSDFEKYNCEPFNKTQVIRNLGSMMKSGSCLTWLDTRVPIYSKQIWKLLGYIGIIISTNTRIRCLSLFEKI